MENISVISWTAREHEHPKKSADWFWAVGLLSLACALAAFIFDNILFGLLVVIAGFTLMLHAARGARTHTYEITAKGIVAHTSLYPYETLHSFWIHDEYPPKKLILKSKRTLLPHIALPLGEVNEADVRQLLRPKLKEQKHDPSLVEVIADYLDLYI